MPAVCVGGEFMHTRQRSVLTSAFGSVPYVRYGSNELHEVASQCEVQDGLHIHSEDFVVEVVDDSGSPVPPGRRGRLLITSLHNDGMPFIRYATGDIGTLRTDVCPCGRGLPLLDVRIARTRDMIVPPAGARTAAIDVDIASLLPPDTVNYQLVQESVDHFLLRAVTAEAAGSPACATLQRETSERLSSTLGAPVSVQVQPVADIDMNMSGKRLAFISKITRDPVAEMPVIGMVVARGKEPMSLYNDLARNVMAPALDLIRGCTPWHASANWKKPSGGQRVRSRSCSRSASKR